MNAQEQFWKGQFGTEYAKRNQGLPMLAANIALFGKALARTNGVQSIIELGANIGMNMSALRFLYPDSVLTGLEINDEAFAQLADNPQVTSAFHDSILNWYPTRKWDMAFTKGVLIHIAPDDLPKAYSTLYAAAGKYILVAEYYSPTPREIEYRGHAGKLWARDFAGELLDRYKDLRLVDYGFQYHRDPNWPADDITWSLLEKVPA